MKGRNEPSTSQHVSILHPIITTSKPQFHMGKCNKIWNQPVNFERYHIICLKTVKKNHFFFPIKMKPKLQKKYEHNLERLFTMGACFPLNMMAIMGPPFLLAFLSLLLPLHPLSVSSSLPLSLSSPLHSSLLFLPLPSPLTPNIPPFLCLWCVFSKRSI